MHDPQAPLFDTCLTMDDLRQMFQSEVENYTWSYGKGPGRKLGVMNGQIRAALGTSDRARRINFLRELTGLDITSSKQIDLAQVEAILTLLNAPEVRAAIKEWSSHRPDIEPLPGQLALGGL